jgi:hypothetical protein
VTVRLPPQVTYHVAQRRGDLVPAFREALMGRGTLGSTILRELHHEGVKTQEGQIDRVNTNRGHVIPIDFRVA